MGVIDKFERGIERAVNGAFAKAFRSEVQPIELAAGLRREMDNNANLVARGRTLVPNAFTITMSPDDHQRFASWEDQLAQELAGAVHDHARQQRYTFVGPVMIRFKAEARLSRGIVEFEAHQQKGTVAPAATTAVATVNHPVLVVNGRNFQLTQQRTVIGRGEDADIVLDDPGVSRHHCAVVLEGGNVVMRDLGSTNGTFVDGERSDSSILHDNSTINLGRTRIQVMIRRYEDR